MILPTAPENSPDYAPDPNARVRVRLSRPGEELCETVPPDQIDLLIRDPGVTLWVDIEDPGTAELEMLAEEFGFHRLALEDAAHQNQRPKVDEYPGYFFVVMYAPVEGEQPEQLGVREMDLFVGRNYVVSLHRGEIPALQEALSRWRRTDPALRPDIGFLVHTVVDSVIDAYFPLVDQIEDRLDDLEMELFSGRMTIGTEELLAVKRSLFTLRKTIYPLREVFNVFLRRDSPLITPQAYPYFQDVYDHVLRLLDTVDIQRDMATGTLDAFLAVTSNRLNVTMQRLTVVAVVVAIMGAVFGAWGMNFSHVPLEHLGITGFYLVSGGAILLTLGAILWARWKGLW